MISMVWTGAKNGRQQMAQTSAGMDATRTEEAAKTERWFGEGNLGSNGTDRSERTTVNG
jgi:hypothetical protein